jgi:hypothetical protein
LQVKGMGVLRDEAFDGTLAFKAVDSGFNVSNLRHLFLRVLRVVGLP